MCHTGGVVTGRKAYDRSASNFAILQSFYIHMAIDLLYKHLLVVKHYTAMAIPGKSPGRSSVRVRSPSGYQIWQGESQENHIFYKRLSICNAHYNGFALPWLITGWHLRCCCMSPGCFSVRVRCKFCCGLHHSLTIGFPHQIDQ